MKIGHSTTLPTLKCAHCIKRSNCVFHIKRLNQKRFFSVINTSKTLPKNVETPQPLLNVLPVFDITEKSVGTFRGHRATKSVHRSSQGIMGTLRGAMWDL